MNHGFQAVEFQRALNLLAGGEDQTESQIEQDIQRLFHHALGYSKDAARRQVTNIGYPGKSDIVLQLDAKTSVVVEIKRPDEFKRTIQRIRAISQAADYLLCEPKQEYGIATDGRRWVFFRVVPYATYYRAHCLLDFHIDEHPRVARCVLRRCQPGTLKNLLRVLAAMHQHATPADFDALMNDSWNDRVDKICKRVKEQGLRVSVEDTTVIREIYNGGYIPTQLSEAMLSYGAISLTKKQRTRSAKPTAKVVKRQTKASASKKPRERTSQKRQRA
jgi:hypothetical protein